MTVRRTSRKRIEEVLIRQRGGGVWAEAGIRQAQKASAAKILLLAIMTIFFP